MATIDEEERFTRRPDVAITASMTRTPGAGTQLGRRLRSEGQAAGNALARGAQAGANAFIGGAEVGINTLSSPFRTAGGFARDTLNAVSGNEPSPYEGQPAQAFRFPRVRRPTVAANASTVPAAADAAPALSKRPMATVGGSKGVVATPVVSGAGNTGGDDGAGISLRPGDVNTFTGSDGVTRAVPGLINSTPASPVPTSSRPAIPAVVPPSQSAQYAARGRQGGIISNPGRGTLADQVTRAMSSLSLKGSPQGRRLAAEAVLAEAGWRANERQSALNTGDQADLAAVNMQGAAAEAAANRDLQAQQTNAQLAHQERQGQASRDSARELAMIARRPEITSAADGTLGIISGEGSFQPVTGPDGQAIRGPRQSAVPATDRLKAYNERYKTIMEGFGTAEEKQAALAQMGQDPLLQGQPSTEQTVAQGVPPAGAVIDGYRFKGGDPSNKDNWEKVNG